MIGGFAEDYAVVVFGPIIDNFVHCETCRGQFVDQDFLGNAVSTAIFWDAFDRIAAGEVGARRKIDNGELPFWF